jgi:hypothetical protein
MEGNSNVRSAGVSGVVGSAIDFPAPLTTVIWMTSNYGTLLGDTAIQC